VLLVVTYSRAARRDLRNACRGHEETVVRRFGRAALFEATGHGALLALRLREKHPDDVQVERTRPFNEFADAPDAVREAAVAYEARDDPSTPYRRFAAGTDHPDPESLKDREL
jgi:ferritin-like protein